MNPSTAGTEPHPPISADEAVRAVVIPAPGAPAAIRRYPVPKLEPGGVLLKTIAAEVCGTDVHLWHGRLSGVPYPLIPGHVSVGEIIGIGGEVTDIGGNPVHVGQAVTFLDVHGTCHHCYQCLVARTSTRCPHRRVYGITFGAEDGLCGGWSEAIYLKPGTLILPLAEHVTPEMWIGGGCGLPTAVHAIELARVRLGDRVLIQGSGPVGISAAALARLSGASWVGVIGAPETRLLAAREFGADWTMDVMRTTSTERIQAAKDATGCRGPDIVIEASGNPNAVSEGCDLVRDAGRYVIVGQYTDNGSIELNPHLQINRKHLEILGCWGSDYSHLWRAMEVMESEATRGGLDWSQLISHRYTLEQAGQALADVEAGRTVKAVILPNGLGVGCGFFLTPPLSTVAGKSSAEAALTPAPLPTVAGKPLVHRQEVVLRWGEGSLKVVSAAATDESFERSESEGALPPPKKPRAL